jgi:hypothetical protein
MALDGIVEGSVAKIDIWKLLGDTEDDKSLPSGAAGYKNKRYAILSFGVGVGLVMYDKWARPYKPYFGTSAYDIAKTKCWLKGLYEFQDWQVVVDGQKLTTPGHDSL